MTRISIIGTGDIALYHLRAYLLFPKRCQIVAVVNRTVEKAHEFAKHIPYEVQIFSDLKAMFQTMEVDAVSICTPPFTHKDLVVECLESGAHVMCEKPMAVSVEDCDIMLEAQKKSKKLLTICHQNRFRNDVQEVKHVLDSQLLGRLLFTRVDSFWWRSNAYYELWWRGTWEKEGGGCVLNHAVHQLDLMLWFLQKKPHSLLSTSYNLAHKNSEVEDFNTTIMNFPDNSCVQFTTNLIGHGEDQELSFHCEKGKINTPWSVYCSKALDNGFVDGRDDALEKKVDQVRREFQTLKHERHAGAIDNFLDAIDGKVPLLVTGDDGKNVIELITAIYKSHFEKKEVSPHIQSHMPWYRFESILDKVQKFNT